MNSQEFVEQLEKQGEVQIIDQQKYRKIIRLMKKNKKFQEFVRALQEEGLTEFEIGYTVAMVRAWQEISHNIEEVTV